ncbi:MAG: hypothetical protein ACERLB_05090, partial [Gammaproteobacteria bacterium]
CGPPCLAAETIGLPPPEAPLPLLVYKMEVLNYCGMIDDEVSEGFQQRRDHIITSQNLSPENVQNARMEGWKFGLAEWQNRGLGGFKNWCKTDGKEIAEYFRNSGIPHESCTHR